MTRFCPHYPPPVRSRLGLLTLFLRKRHSMLNGLFARSYTMKMGEVRIPGAHAYMVNEPPLVRRVMVSEWAQFPKHEMLAQALRPLLGDSIFTTNGPAWARQRALMDPAFEAARVKRVFGRMWEAAEAMRARLAALPPGQPLDAEVEMTHVAADTILRTIISQPLDSAGARQVFEAFTRYQAIAPRILMPAFFGLRWLRPWWQVRKSRQPAAEIRNLIATLIRPRFEAAQAGQPDAHDDILSALLAQQAFGFDELVDQVAMLFLAGHETSASALAWSLHLLANAPDVQARLAAEADTWLDAVATDPGAMTQLKLSRNVFREALRLFPPVGFFVRTASQTCTMRDKTVKAGASVVVAPWLIHRHRQLWARPDEFDPDRFTRDEPDDAVSAKDSVRQAYLPFGLGPRICIGAAFALQEATLVLAVVARHFQVRPVPGRVPTPVGRLTIRSGDGIWLYVAPR
ncbi:MAG: cytochrome P450 [Proteobacteria bacterium]|nr:cytochrome P450 [Pseudomonadota bacterium]